jgi:hypothetical protein
MLVRIDSWTLCLHLYLISEAATSNVEIYLKPMQVYFEADANHSGRFVAKRPGYSLLRRELRSNNCLGALSPFPLFGAAFPGRRQAGNPTSKRRGFSQSPS